MSLIPVLGGYLVDTAVGEVVQRLQEGIATRYRESRERRAGEGIARTLDLLRAANVHLPEGERLNAAEDALSAEPEAQARLLEQVEDLLAAIDPAAVPLLCLLYADYAVENRPRDRFLRSAGQLLRNASGQEIADLRALLESVAPYLDQDVRGQPSSVELVVRDGEVNGALFGKAPGQPDGSDGVDRFRFTAPARWSLLFAMLKSHHLGSDNPGGGYLDVETGEHVILFGTHHVEGLRRLCKLVTA